jgi:hypothetical protein
LQWSKIRWKGETKLVGMEEGWKAGATIANICDDDLGWAASVEAGCGAAVSCQRARARERCMHV